jgi:hypothetical protein
MADAPGAEALLRLDARDAERRAAEDGDDVRREADDPHHPGAGRGPLGGRGHPGANTAAAGAFRVSVW